jgi:hypothetical protein
MVSDLALSGLGTRVCRVRGIKPEVQSDPHRDPVEEQNR